MTHAEVSGLDLGGMSKAQLKLYVKKAREVWGEWIDLRKADVIALQQYLQDYQAWAAKIAALAEKMEEQEAIEISEIEADATDTQTTEAYRGCGIYISPVEGGYTARVRDLDSEIDFIVQATSKEEVRSLAIAAIDNAFAKMIEAETDLQDLPDFENGKASISRVDEPIQLQLPFVAEVVREGAKAMLESLKKRSEGAMDEALMQQYIDRAGLFEELEKAWREIPDYEEFSEIFRMESHLAVIAEIFMSEQDHKRYVAVCKQALAIEQQFARKALERLAR